MATTTEVNVPHHNEQPAEVQLSGAMFSISMNVLATLIISIAMGMTAILFPVTMEGNGVRSSLIGTILSLETIAALGMCFLLPGLLRSLGMRIGMLLSTAVRVPPLLFLMFSDSLSVWLIGVFCHGVGCFTFLILLQTWVNSIPVKKNRGLMVALYSTAISIGLAMGPVILNNIDNHMALFQGLVDSSLAPLAASIGVTETEFGLLHAKFFIALVINLMATIPVLLAIHTVPKFQFNKSVSIIGTIMNCKGPMFAIAMGGVSIFGVSAFITIYGMRNGMELEHAALLMTSFMLGSLVLEVPLAWASDFVDRRYMIVICAFLCMVCAVYLPIAIYVPWQAWALLFIWGGLIGAIYSVALALIGERYTGEELVSANAGYSVMDSAGGTAGILLIGFCMDTFGPDGLPYVIMLASIIYFSFALTRYRVV